MDPSQPPEPAPEQYTVGWICAISEEYVAAKCFLDEEHTQLDCAPANDHNVYSLGRIGRHNVVIAVLPEYGLTNSSKVANDLTRTFPNIRIGLMVGIGGGVWSVRHDIRLGDVVVGVPCNGLGGVLQYDHGKAIQDEAFQHTGFQNQPPALLRAAVNDLKAEYETNGHTLQAMVNEILQKRKRLVKKYGRPDPASDILFKSSVTHEINCAGACCFNHLAVVTRPSRDEEDDDPTIHHGTIASANRLMKDAMARDKLAEEKDILCFEMEAAGLMNEFPCLVIPGICDYADTHKVCAPLPTQESC